MSSDKAQRSIFVGNIPYDVSETKLRDMFSKVGPISSFRLVYDKETGKPKGYGFCEYCDVETAQSALRNLANADVAGRPLRVGPAAGEQHFIQNMDSGPNVVQPSQSNVVNNSSLPTAVPDWSDHSKVNQAIVEIVYSMSPENLAEVLRNFKYFAVANPSEARVMLAQNPTLSYSLVQALVVLRAVDSKTLPSLFHRQGNHENVGENLQKSNSSYEPAFVSKQKFNIPEDNYKQFSDPRDNYNPGDKFTPPRNEFYVPSRKRKMKNFDPRNFPRFSTNVLKGIAAGGRSRVDDQERRKVVDQLMEMTDEQIERYLPREQVEIAFSIRKRY